MHQSIRRAWTAAAGVVLLAPALAWTAQDQSERVTVQMRDGAKVAGQLEDLERGTLYVRVTQDDQRKLPIGDVALIDRVGGAAGLPETELRAARKPAPVVILSNGSSLEATLTDVEGGSGSGDPGKPRVFVFRLKDGGERRLANNEVGRIYMGSFPSAEPDLGEGDVRAGAIRVPATSRWVDTGLTVRTGQLVGFDTTGKVQLSDNPDDVATSPGRERHAPGSPIPDIGAGALIGRIGANGQPFAIGDQNEVPMPGAGRLYLAVNDDELSDNRGAYNVVLTRVGRR